MLVLVPTSPRNGSIIAGILSIVEFIILIFAIASADYIQEKGFIALVVIFLILCIISSVLLIIGVIKVGSLFMLGLLVKKNSN